MTSLEDIMTRATKSESLDPAEGLSNHMKAIGELLSTSVSEPKSRDYHGLSREYHENEMALLATWYVENRVQWHSKYTTMAGKGDGVQVMDKLAQQWANELTRMGFAARTIASVKQKIRDLRKRARLVNSKDRMPLQEHRLRSTARGRPMKVPEWLQAVADAMVADEEAANGIINQLDGTECNSNSSAVNCDDDDTDSTSDQKYDDPQDLLNTLFAAPGTAGPPAKRCRTESAYNGVADLNVVSGCASPCETPPLSNGICHEVGKIDASIDAVVNGGAKQTERPWMSNEFACGDFGSEGLGVRDRNQPEMMLRTQKLKQRTEMLKQVTERMKQRTEKLRQLVLEEQLKKLGVPEETFMALE